MNVSQKCQYALRAVFELAKRNGDMPVRSAEIAEAQAIPPRFLELILGELRRAGIVESQRGVQGGYRLSSPPSLLTVGEVIRLIDGPLAPVKCVAGDSRGCPLFGKCAFMSLWERARDAVSEVYDNTTFESLVNEEQVRSGDYVTNYCI